MAGPQAMLQHLLDRAGKTQLGRAADFLRGQRRAGDADRLPGTGQEIAPRIDDRNVLRAKPRHRRSDQIDDRLNAAAVEPRHAGHGQQHAGLRVLPVTGERLTFGQDQMHPGGAHPVYGADGAGQLALHRAGLVDLLLEVGCRHAVTAVEYFVSDGATGRQAVLRQQQPRRGDLIDGNQDLATLAGQAVGDVVAGQVLHHLTAVAQIEVAVQQRHPIAAATHRQHREQAKYAHRHRRHGAKPHRTQRAQPVEQGFHAAPGAKPWGLDL